MKKQKKLYGLLLSLLLACSLLFPGSMASVEAAGQGDMAVHFIDVGQGLAVLVQSAGENLLLFSSVYFTGTKEKVSANRAGSCIGIFEHWPGCFWL